MKEKEKKVRKMHVYCTRPGAQYVKLIVDGYMDSYDNTLYNYLLKDFLLKFILK